MANPDENVRTETHDGQGREDDATSPTEDQDRSERRKYWRFGAMIATSATVMLVLMYLNTYAWDHVRWSETRFYMAILMGASMALIMLGFMLGMYRNTKANVAIAVGAVAVFAGSLFLVRSQTTVQDSSYMSAMIPHHSIAILTSENSEIRDLRVCDLAVGIIEAQRREIDEMDWLIADIAENGPAETVEEAEARPIPEFEGASIRSCEGDSGSQ